MAIQVKVLRDLIKDLGDEQYIDKIEYNPHSRAPLRIKKTYYGYVLTQSEDEEVKKDQAYYSLSIRRKYNLLSEEEKKVADKLGGAYWV